MFFPHIRRYYHLIRALWRTLDFGPIPLPIALKPPPTLTKIPLVRWLPGTRYENVHATTPINLSEVTGILLHFKFLQDFYTRVSTELNRKDYRLRGVWVGELKRYLLSLQRDPSLSFHYAGSVAYESSDQLVRLGLLREDQGWKQIREVAASDPGAWGDEGLASPSGAALATR